MIINIAKSHLCKNNYLINSAVDNFKENTFSSNNLDYEDIFKTHDKLTELKL